MPRNNRDCRAQVAATGWLPGTAVRGREAANQRQAFSSSHPASWSESSSQAQKEKGKGKGKAEPQIARHLR